MVGIFRILLFEFYDSLRDSEVDWLIVKQTRYLRDLLECLAFYE